MHIGGRDIIKLYCQVLNISWVKVCKKKLLPQAQNQVTCQKPDNPNIPVKIAASFDDS